MLKKTAQRSIDMTLLDSKTGTIKVRDTGAFWSKEYEWRYNLCLPFEENERTLLNLLYNDSNVDYCVSEELLHYILDRKELSKNLGFYEDIVNSIYNSLAPDHIKSSLFATINADLYQNNPYNPNKKSS